LLNIKVGEYAFGKMRKLLHPFSILILAALPFVLYSIWRTGFQVTHFFDVRLLATHYLLEAAALTTAVFVCCFCYRRGEKKIFSIITLIVIGVFLALQATEEHPTDYKLWIYIVPSMFAWSLVISAGLMLRLRIKGDPESHR
jgi:hypothetical protein